MYTAAVLLPSSQDLLRWIMRGTIKLEDKGFEIQTEGGLALPHHMTINMGKLDVSLNAESIFNCPAILTIDKLIYCKSLGVCAAPVKQAIALRLQDDDPMVAIKTINEHPHITVCLKPGVRPIASNELLDKQDGYVTKLDKDYGLEARIIEVK